MIASEGTAGVGAVGVSVTPPRATAVVSSSSALPPLQVGSLPLTGQLCVNSSRPTDHQRKLVDKSRKTE